MGKLNKNIIILFISFNSIFLFSQNIIIKDVVGFCEKNDLIPLETIKKCALKKALVNAFEKSGIELELQSTFIESSISNDSIVQSKHIFDIQSKYINSKILDYGEVIYEHKNKFLYACIKNVTLIKYETKLDDEFIFHLNGIRNIYKDGENLLFTFKPNKNGYLNIFYTENNNAIKLFPSEDEKDNFFKKDKKYFFPRNKYLDYTLKSTQNEDNVILFVFTKYDISYDDEFSEKNLYKEIYSLKQGERVFNFIPIKILKK
jgi:hypothetical protein